jgi:hypothetical protein
MHRARLFNSGGDGVKNGDSIHRLTSLPRCHSASDFRPILDHLPGMKKSLIPSNSLYDDSRILINKDAHGLILLSTAIV